MVRDEQCTIFPNLYDVCQIVEKCASSFNGAGSPSYDVISFARSVSSVKAFNRVTIGVGLLGMFKMLVNKKPVKEILKEVLERHNDRKKKAEMG